MIKIFSCLFVSVNLSNTSRHFILRFGICIDLEIHQLYPEPRLSLAEPLLTTLPLSKYTTFRILCYIGSDLCQHGIKASPGGMTDVNGESPRLNLFLQMQYQTRCTLFGQHGQYLPLFLFKLVFGLCCPIEVLFWYSPLNACTDLITPSKYSL